MRDLATMVKFNEDNHEYKLGGIHIPSMSEMMLPIMGTYPLDPYYAERGTAVHDLTEAIDKNRFDPILSDPELLPYMFAYQDWHEAHEVEILEIEKVLFNPKLLYAGTMDRMWIIDGEKNLTDIKSGLKYRQHVIQLVGYALCNFGEFKISNLYLNPYINKFHTWTDAESMKAVHMVESLSAVYWEIHRRDLRLVSKFIKEQQNG